MSGIVIWLTGYSGAGKTTLSLVLHTHLTARGVPCEILDGDLVRNNLSKGLGFSKEDRNTNIERIGFVAQLLHRHGVCVIVSAISPYRESRTLVRATIRNFVEVYVKCSIEMCEKRDPKGLYAKARKGELKNFTGVNDPYEEPLHPEVVCNTELETPEESASKILDVLKVFKYIY